ncbi:unnamed protein product (macronuclear) [Paramecium tetraurelia]|uniref:C2 domain-containing protein n=1 Tax=Paramecium tetraurelia TaxID=5888 RepID=A0C586_PARTE|nr:uncharacterized protein GSPATT00006452001 [Paramecium tetraurelia]CAK65953.1 unnamed protein product [Paramecium tetraurelia]|eukprot:XP_001433350.1 hypothetical protein (macronuclear) [Paramecium tetraurelia strain d4-2]
MKSPTYILKNAYQEHLVEQQYIKHVSKIQNITANLQVSQSEQDQLNKIKYYRQQKERTRKFMEHQTQLFRQQSDNLIRKVEKSMNRRKQQSYEIGLENIRLGKRILHLPSVIKKREFDKSYAKHEQNMMYASRMRNQNKSKTPSNKLIKDCGPIFTEVPIAFKLVVFNKELQNKDQKTECLYCVEAHLKDQLLHRTDSVAFDQFQQLSFKVPMNEQQYEGYQNEPLILKIWKIKNNSELYMGQIFVGFNDQLSEKDLMKRVNDREIWNGFIQL